MEVDELGREPGRRRRGGNGENPNASERKSKESVSCGVEDSGGWIPNLGQGICFDLNG